MLDTTATMVRMTVTPEMARDWMALNEGNRSPSMVAVRRYAADMRARRWISSGTKPISFFRDGSLADGQHRLLACIEADTPFDTWVERGVDPAARMVIDTGRARKMADLLQFHGHKNTVQLGAVAKALWNLKHKKAPGTNQASFSEQMDIVERHPSAVDSVSRWGCLPKRVTGLTKTNAALIHFLISSLLKRPEEAEAFLEVFKSGHAAYSGCPAHACREWMRKKQDKLPADVEWWVIVNAANQFLAKTPNRGFKRIETRTDLRGLKLEDI